MNSGQRHVTGQVEEKHAQQRDVHELLEGCEREWEGQLAAAAAKGAARQMTGVEREQQRLGEGT